MDPIFYLQDTARFQCRLSKLNSNLQWFKDGVRILPSDRVVYSIKGDLLSLTIHNAHLEDQGNYRCMVDTQHTDATLTVERMSTCLTVVSDTTSFFMLLNLAIPATFTKFLPKTWTVNSGEPLELSCQLSKPNARVTWLKDGLPLDDRCLTKNEGLRYNLYVPHAVEPGRYTIRIDDADGQESTCQVSVEGMSIFSRRIKRLTCLGIFPF